MYQLNSYYELELHRLRRQELEREWAKRRLLPHRTRRWTLNLLNWRRNRNDRQSHKLTSEPTPA